MEKIVIAAMAANRTIGCNNTLPWHIPEELQLFKKITMGFPLIMGRRTMESLPGILPGRRHIVLSRNPEFFCPGTEHAGSLKEAFALCRAAGSEKVFLIGGAGVFSQALAVADTLRLTVLHREVAGDRFFPPFEERYSETTRREYSAGEPFTVIEYERRK